MMTVLFVRNPKAHIENPGNEIVEGRSVEIVHSDGVHHVKLRGSDGGMSCCRSVSKDGYARAAYIMNSAGQTVETVRA